MEDNLKKYLDYLNPKLPPKDRIKDKKDWKRFCKKYIKKRKEPSSFNWKKDWDYSYFLKFINTSFKVPQTFAYIVFVSKDDGVDYKQVIEICCKKYKEEIRFNKQKFYTFGKKLEKAGLFKKSRNEIGRVVYVSTESLRTYMEKAINSGEYKPKISVQEFSLT